MHFLLLHLVVFIAKSLSLASNAITSPLESNHELGKGHVKQAAVPACPVPQCAVFRFSQTCCLGNFGMSE